MARRGPTLPHRLHRSRHRIGRAGALAARLQRRGAVLTLESAQRCRLADGRELAFAEYGDPAGTALFFLHGFPGSRLWGRIAHEPALRSRVRVIAPDRPGIGLSTPSPGRTLVDHAGDLGELADRLDIERFAVLGDSGGGPYAAACAFALPERLLGAAIVNGLAAPGTPQATRGMAAGERAALAFASRAPAASARLLTVVAALARRSRSGFLRLVRTQLARPDRRVLARPELAELFVEDFLEGLRQGAEQVAVELALLLRPWPFRLEQIRAPVRIHHGALDRTVPVVAARHHAAALPGSTLSVYEGEGHHSLLVNRLDEILADLLG